MQYGAEERLVGPRYKFRNENAPFETSIQNDNQSNTPERLKYDLFMCWYHHREEPASRSSCATQIYAISMAREQISDFITTHTLYIYICIYYIVTSRVENRCLIHVLLFLILPHRYVCSTPLIVNVLISLVPSCQVG